MRPGVVVSPKSRRRASAVGGSLFVHGLIFLALTAVGPARLGGAPGQEQGAGIDVTLVSATTLGLAIPHAPPMDDTQARPAPSPPVGALAPAEASLADDGARFAPDDRPQQPQDHRAPQTVAWANQGEANVAATRDGKTRGAGETAGGDPRAADDLIVQIARCLPPTLRPRLLAQRLVLKLDAGGALTAAPAIDSAVPIVTADDRAAADRVVQAALQCGPYRQADASERQVSLAVDFSSVARVTLKPQ